MVSLGRATDDARDYEVVKAKIPKWDKAGNDITGDKIGPGGRRREDGTLSAMAYDFEPIEEGDDANEWFLEYTCDEEEERSERQGCAQDTVNSIIIFMEAIATFVENHPEVVVKIIDGATALGHKMAGGFRSLKAKLATKGSHKRGIHVDELLGAERVLVIEKKLLPAPSTVSEQGNQQTMSVEEARAEILNLLAHYIEIKKSLQRLSNVNIIEIQKLGFDEIIARLEGIVQQYPALIDTTTGGGVLSLELDEPERAKVKEVLHIDPR